jgi:hypothetical protein
MSFEYDVFLSYSSKDREKVESIAIRLQADGFRVWFDQFVIKPGTHIPTAVEQGLENSRTIVALLSPHAFGSDWVGVERGAFLMGDPRNLEGRFLPVLLEECEPPRWLRTFRMILYYQDPSGAYRKLLTAIRDEALTSLPTVEAPEDGIGGISVRPGLMRRARQFPRLACPAYLQRVWVTGGAKGW